MGISLIFGIFTTLEALGSAGMSINFLLTEQYPHFSSDLPGHFSTVYWMLFGSIALIGSGHSFGLDYYIKNLIWNRAKGKNKDLQKVVEKTNFEA